ncbi:MAG: DUF1634 domain-containing protein [Synechococcales cyanobacterium C42_A2020_086]|nr:DUF1634 domain-containing protein [Synechococcales cyanobacterium C42_A2020_086]
MSRRTRTWSDEQIEQTVGNLLRFGVLLAAGVVALGGVLYLFRYGNTTPDYHIFRGEPSSLRSPTGIVSEALLLERRGLIQLGLLLLIATPIARVAFSVVAFWKQRDHLYVAITLVVLGILCVSLTGLV